MRSLYSEDAELGALVREAKSLGVTAVSLSEHIAGYCMSDLFIMATQGAPGSADMVAMVHATGKGSTVLEALRDAVSKLRKTRQLAAPKVDKVIVDVPPMQALNPADKIPRLSMRK